jgi:hypothetical protein
MTTFELNGLLYFFFHLLISLSKYTIEYHFFQYNVIFNHKTLICCDSHRCCFIQIKTQFVNHSDCTV